MSLLGPGNIRAPLKTFAPFCIPPEGPMAIPMQWSFTTTDQSREADISNFIQTQNISYIQSMFVDNSRNPVAMVIRIPNAGQRIEIPGGHQAYLHLQTPNPPRIFFDSAVASDTPVGVTLMNYPVSNAVWAANPSIAPIIVTDPVLDALLVNGYLPTQQLVSTSDGLLPEPFAARTFELAKTTTASQTLIAAPGAAFRVYLESLQISLSAGAAMGAAGQSLLTVRESTTTPIMRLDTYLPNAGGTTPFAGLHQTYSPRVLLAANQPLTAILNTALTAGAWNIAGSYSVVPV